MRSLACKFELNKLATPFGLGLIYQPHYWFRALGWPKLKHQRLVSTSIMMYKTVHGMTPEYLRSRFVSQDDITFYRLRNSENKLALPQPSTNYLKKSFSYSGAKLWNSLSHDLRSAASLNDFKRKLRHHSFERVQYAPYSILEKQL